MADRFYRTVADEDGDRRSHCDRGGRAMNLPDEKREELTAYLFGAATSREVFASPMAAGGYAKWSEGIADALAPLLAGWLAEARGKAVRSMAHLFRDMAQETLPRHEVIALLDLRAESYRADAAEATGEGA